jgi:cytochrome c-type biogenesis protein CcmE
MADTDVRTSPPGRREQDPGVAARRRRSRRTRTYIATGVIVIALGWVGIGALRSNLVYYRTPTELLRLGSSGVGQQIRLGGLVEPGSVCTRGTLVRFVLTDLKSNVTVSTSRAVPQLFAEGRGVIAEGSYGADRVFHADDVLVKHNDAYSPPTTGVIPRATTPACG